MSDNLHSFRQEQNQKIGDINVQGKGHHLDFSLKQVIQISVNEIKQRKFISASPYKGLKQFYFEDRDDFFGRDQFLKKLVLELQTTNLIILLGASGSGKSSVIRAGLIPYLGEKMKSRFIDFTFTPDQDPFESLYACLLKRYSQQDAQVARKAKSETLIQIVKSLRKPESYWFIFIDQFEELFTSTNAAERECFLASLIKLDTALKKIKDPKACPIKVVATMRADFLDQLSPYPELVELTEGHRPMIAEMHQNELRLVIEQPAAHHGVVFETGLVEEIIKDVQGQAGYLPLLQYTLNLLWNRESKKSAFSQERTLYAQTYRGLGGVRGALQKHVDQFYKPLQTLEKNAVQRIFLKLVEIGEDEKSGTAWKPVRKRAPQSDFQGNNLEEKMLAKLIDENLLISDRKHNAIDPTIEISHEILLTSWEALKFWIKENRQAITLRNRLNDDVMRWQKTQQEEELWTGSKLEQALELRNSETFSQVLGGFSPIANQFINASLKLREDLKRKAIRQAWGITIISVIALILVSIAGIVAIVLRQEALQQRQTALEQTKKAEQQRQIAFARQLIAQAEAEKSQGDSSQLQLSMLLAIEGVQRLNEHGMSSGQGGTLLQYGLSIFPPRIASSLEGEYATLKRDLIDARACQLYIEDDSECISPNGKFKLEVTHSMGLSPGLKNLDFVVNVRNTETQRLMSVLPVDARIFSFAFSPDSKLVTMAGDIWDLTFGEASSRMLSIPAEEISFSHDGKRLYISNTEEKSYDVLSIEQVKEINQNLNESTGVKTISLDTETIKLSPHAKYVMLSSDHALQIMNIATEKIVLELDADSSAIFSVDEKYIATINTKNDILKVVEISTGNEIFNKNIATLANQLVDKSGQELENSLFCSANMGSISFSERVKNCLKKFISGEFIVSEKEIYFAYENSWVGSLWRLRKNEIELIPVTPLGRTTGLLISQTGRYLATTNRANIATCAIQIA